MSEFPSVEEAPILKLDCLICSEAMVKHLIQAAGVWPPSDDPCPMAMAMWKVAQEELDRRSSR